MILAYAVLKIEKLIHVILLIKLSGYFTYS